MNSTVEPEYEMNLEKIRDRAQTSIWKYKDKNFQLNVPDIFDDLVNGKIIYLFTTMDSIGFIKSHIKSASHFALSPNKYLLQIVNFSFYKKNLLHNTMIYL